MTFPRHVRHALVALTGVGVAGIMVVQASTGMSSAAATDRPIVDHTHALGWDGSPLVPGREVIECVTLTHRSDDPTAVRLHAATATDGPDELGEHLEVTVEQVDIGDGTCADPSSATWLFTGPLSGADGALAHRHGLDRDGLVLGWSPRRVGEQQTYRLSITLRSGDHTRGLTAHPTFVWRFDAS